MGVWTGAGGAGIGAGGGIISAYGQHLAQKKQNQWNLERRDDAWRREERLANSAHQREVRDLRLAGLNPILSAGGGGASSPVGGMITSTDPSKGAETAASSVMHAARLKAELALMGEQTRKVGAEADLVTSKAFPRGVIESAQRKALDFAKRNAGTAKKYGKLGLKAIGTVSPAFRAYDLIRNRGKH